ncbi:hypothetical protein ACJX0J_015180, partial [Zea mays]
MTPFDEATSFSKTNYILERRILLKMKKFRSLLWLIENKEKKECTQLEENHIYANHFLLKVRFPSCITHHINDAVAHKQSLSYRQNTPTGLAIIVNSIYKHYYFESIFITLSIYYKLFLYMYILIFDHGNVKAPRVGLTSTL